MPYKDIEKQRKAQRESSKRRAEKISSYQKGYRKEKRKWYFDLMETLGCNTCSETSSTCLEWHHLDPSNKLDNVAYLAHSNCAKQRILNEMEKCIVLCSNCHKKYHAGLIHLKRKDNGRP